MDGEAEAVVVGVRVRPFNDRETSLGATLCIEMEGATTAIRSGADALTSFTFDESFWSHDGFEPDETGYSRPKPGSNYADQTLVFEKFGKRVLDNAWEGFHCCLFAYGQTGSGKSYSMVGYGQNKGIVPISCEEIFSRIERNPKPDLRFEVVVSVVEIYNEVVQDLLIQPSERPKKGLEIRENKMLGIYIDKVIKRAVASYAAIEKTIDEATNNRTVGSTLMNATSSRAHTVLTIEFKQVNIIEGNKESTKVAMINLVDLAGSEKAGQTGATGDRLKEGAAINKSLSALGNVIEKLAQKSSGKKVVIPYRDSKLTRLLQNALGGSSKTIMICALSPASVNYEETLSTLRYADRAKKIKNAAIVNENPQEKLMRQLKEENEKLRIVMEQVGGAGGVDLEAFQDKVAEIKAAEEALKEQQRSFEERLKEAGFTEPESQDDDMVSRLRSKLIGTAKEVPHILNLNEDMLLTGRMKHRFPEGQTVRIGQLGEDLDGEEEISEPDGSDCASGWEDEKPDVILAGTGIFQNHATVTNSNHQCVLRSRGKPANATFVNGVSFAVLHKQRKLSLQRRPSAERADIKRQDLGVSLVHGDRVAFGQCLYLFVDPLICTGEVLLSSGQSSYADARKELAKNQWKAAGLKFMKGMKEATAFGTSNLEKSVLRKISSVENSSGTSLNKRRGSVGNDALGTISDSDDNGGSVASLDNETAMEMLREKDIDLAAKDKLLIAKDREIAQLRRELINKEAEAAMARAEAEAARSAAAEAAAASTPHQQGITGDAKDLPTLGGTSLDTEDTSSKKHRARHNRAEMLATVEAALGALQHVEHIFSLVPAPISPDAAVATTEVAVTEDSEFEY